jgi:hypothetical protein
MHVIKAMIDSMVTVILLPLVYVEIMVKAIRNDKRIWTLYSHCKILAVILALCLMYAYDLYIHVVHSKELVNLVRSIECAVFYFNNIKELGLEICYDAIVCVILKVADLLGYYVVLLHKDKLTEQGRERLMKSLYENLEIIEDTSPNYVKIIDLLEEYDREDGVSIGDQVAMDNSPAEQSIPNPEVINGGEEGNIILSNIERIAKNRRYT